MLAKFIYRIMLRLQVALLIRWWKFIGRILLQIKGVSFQRPPILYGLPIVSMLPDSKIVLGDDVLLCSDSRFTDLGVAKPVILRTLRPNASIEIGADSGLSGTVVCAAVSVKIGTECLIGADVQIFDTDFHKLAAKNRRQDNAPENIGCAPVVIEDNVFIGASSIVMKGVTIGRNSVIGAGSIVSKSIPANCIAAGNPAKVIADLPG